MFLLVSFQLVVSTSVCFYFGAILRRLFSAQKLINTGETARCKKSKYETKPTEKKVRNTNCPSEKFALDSLTIEKRGYMLW